MGFIGFKFVFFFSFYRTIGRKEKDCMLIYILKTKQHYFKMLTHIKSSKLLLGYTKICNHPKPPTTIHNYPKPPTNTHNHSQLPTITHNYPQPPTTTYNHPAPSATTQKLFKKAKACHKQGCYSTLDVHTATDVEFW